MNISRPFFIFLALYLTALSCRAKDPDPVNWESQVVTVQQFSARSDDGDYRLDVALLKPDPVVERVIKTKNGNESRYEYKGSLLPPSFSPGQNLLSGFKLYHHDKEIPIDPKYWKNVTGLKIQKSKIDPKTIPEDREGEFFAFLDSLPQPRIFPSEQGDSILVEWEISGEGGSKTSYRWIIDPSGKILFHCFMPLVGC